MSLYNMINGVNPATFFIMPMLGRRDTEYPRFRDCFISPDLEHIDIFTRVGGNNRNCGYGEEELYKDENFVETFDDEFDSTYATYRFNVPDKWKHDFELIKDSKFEDVSNEYVEYLKTFWPKLNSKGIIDNLFRPIEKG